MNQQQKRELKRILIENLRMRLPIVQGGYRMEAATTASPGDTFLNVKVFKLGPQGNYTLDTYLEVKVKESI